jgi:hypothetical protein
VELLKYDTDPPARFAQGSTFERGEVSAIDQDAPGVRPFDTADAAQKSALARTAETDDAMNGSCFDPQIKLGQRIDPRVLMTIAFGDRFKGHDGSGNANGLGSCLRG